MRQLINRQLVLILGLMMLGSKAFAANVGYYEMCDGRGKEWQITPISAAGHTPVFVEDLTPARLAELDVLYVTNCDNFSYSAEYLSHLTYIDQAVQNGLVLIIHDRKVDNVSSILPGGSNIQSVRGAGRDVDVVDDSTSLTHGPGGVIDSTILDGAQNSEHGYLQAASLPEGARVILSRPDSSMAVVSSYPHGNGGVIYSSVPLDYYAGIMPICIRFIDPMFTSCETIVNIYAPNTVALAAEMALGKPVANAGADLSVDEGSSLTLDATASTGRGTLTYQWQQLSPVSPQIQIDTTAAQQTITAPAVDSNMVFTLQLVVIDQDGNASDPDTVNISVKNVNTPPVADGGDDFMIKQGRVATLDGSLSYDPDGDVISYQWIQVSGPAVSLLTPDAVKTEFVVPANVGAQLVFELIVNDGMSSSQADRVTVTVADNTAPVANAGEDQTRDEGNTILLNALASYDPDRDGMMFMWRQVEGPAVVLDNVTSPTPFFVAPKVQSGGATLVFEVTVTDMDSVNPKTGTDLIAINVRNINDAPACELARPSVASLWPPNHRMRPVAIEGVSDKDNLYKDVAIVINSVTMDEPVVGRGSGHHSPDAVIQNIESGDKVLLRAERKGHSNGRVYQVNFTADDGFESCTGSVKVVVPASRRHGDCGEAHDHGKHKGRKHHGMSKRDRMCRNNNAIDDGQDYDATEILKHGRHDRHEISKKIKKKLAALKEKREKREKKKRYKKKKHDHKKYHKKKHDKDDD